MDCQTFVISLLLSNEIWFGRGGKNVLNAHEHVSCGSMNLQYGVTRSIKYIITTKQNMRTNAPIKMETGTNKIKEFSNFPNQIQCQNLLLPIFL